MRRIAAVLTILLFAAVTPARAGAPGTIDSIDDQLTWTGNVAGTTGAVAVPDLCGTVLTCDEYKIKIKLPAGALGTKGGVQVSIRWVDESEDLDLFVYGPDGALAGKSEGPVSTSESTLIRNAVNGMYRAVVVPVVAEDTAYEATSEVEFLPATEPLRDLVPDLISLPARNLQYQTSAYLLNLPVPSMPNGCYPEETAEQGAMKCLRFDQIIANVGTGAFELRYRIDGIATEDTRDLVQRVYRSDGTYRERVADTYTFHAAHAHFHYENFAQSHLWASNANGDQLGDAPVRSGRKNGFCMVDVEQSGFGGYGDAPRTYIPPGCLLPTELDPETGAFSAISGISVGWADVYNWFLADQFIEVSGLPDGYYLLQNVADQAGTVEEIDDSNNGAMTLIRLCGDKAEIVGVDDRC